MKRIISILICISMLVVVLPINTFAISGVGTENNPYLVSSASDLNAIHNDLDGYYKLTCDINMSGVNFTPIGNEVEGAFAGTIDGAGYSINNLNLNLPDEKYVGFVGYLEGNIKNLNLSNINASGYRYVGGLVGYAEVDSNVYNCSVNGFVSGGFEVISLNVGGIVGYNNGIINNSSNYATISESTDNYLSWSMYYFGGISGYNNGTIENCNNKGAVVPLDSNDHYAGGIVGYNLDTISNCSNFNENISGDTVGGIVGENSGITETCVNYGEIKSDCDELGGIVGINKGTIRYCINNANLVNPSHKIAGVCAKNEKDIICCENNGMISSYTFVCTGGLCAENDGNIRHSINRGNVFNTKNNISSGGSGSLGGISTSENYGNIEKCINLGYLDDTYTSSYEGIAFGGKNTEDCYQLADTNRFGSDSTKYTLLNKIEFTETSSFNNFDFNNIWAITPELCSGMPYLRNMPRHIELNECIKIMQIDEYDSLCAYIGGSRENVVWSCDDVSIATISPDGTITAKGKGICTVTATNIEGMTAKCLIYVYKKADSFKLNSSSITIAAGSKGVVSYTQNPDNADEALRWYSSDNSVATVEKSGEIIAKKTGKTIITATTVNSGLSDMCEVIVIGADINRVSIPSTATINVGKTNKITISISPTEYKGSINWSSSDDSIVSVTNNGEITGLKVGEAYITATADSGVSAQCKVTVNQPATSIKLNKASVTTYVGSTYQLSSTVLPIDTTDTVTWSSSSTSYATVSNTGLVTGVRAGTTTITAKTTSGLTAKCTVTVKPALVEPISITLSDTYITLAPDDAKALTPTFEPSNTTETTLVWTSSDESVATVDKNGVVTAVSNGFATIRGKTTNGLTSECVVKVVSATGTSVLLDNTKASPGGTAQVKANIVKNPGLSAYKFKVNYDASVLTPVSITPNVEFGGTFSTNLDDADRTELNVLWYSGNEDVATNGELFTVNFKVNDSVAYGDSSIVSIEYGANDICDVSGNYIAIYTEDATVSIEEPMPGDIYEDSDVNVYDLTLLARYITSLETFTERQKEAADVNNDERVDILDVIRLAQYLVNWSGIELMSLDLYDEPTTPVINVGSASINELNEAEIPVYIKNNSGILGYRFVLDYNAEDIEILNITPSELINKDGFNHNLGAESQATDGLVVSCFASGNNITDDGVLFTIKVRYKNPADTSVSPISVVDSFDNMGNENATYVTATYETGYALGSDYIVANKVVGDTNFSCELYFDDSYAEQSAKAIIAFYDGDGRMVQLMPKDITVKPGKVDLSIAYDKKAYSTYKLMIWEGMGSLKPITEVK